MALAFAGVLHSHKDGAITTAVAAEVSSARQQDVKQEFVPHVTLLKTSLR